MKKESVLFNGYAIRSFSLDKLNDIPVEKKKKLDLKCNFYQNDSKGNENKYLVSLNLETYTDHSKITLVLDGFFEFLGNLNDEEKDYFLKITAPSILYPYARSFISIVTGFDMDGTLILPIINFNNAVSE